MAKGLPCSRSSYSRLVGSASRIPTRTKSKGELMELA